MTKLPANWKRGINLGNSLDCFREGVTDAETAWGNPRTTRAMIDMFANAGFDMLRIPTTWDVHMGPGPDWTVDPAWMARVKEVVDWGLDAGMTVILNTHHEFPWLRPELSQLVDVLPRFRRLWQQIAETFRDYDERLILQGTNEPNLMGGENCAWGSGNRNIRAGINAVNHTFVRTVRESGGSNATRWLCIPNLAARPLPDCMNDMIMPEDDKLIYTIHSYVPDRFVFQRGDQYDTPFFDAKAADEVAAMFGDIRRYALPHGLPIMITEFAAVSKVLPDGVTRNDEEVVKFIECFCRHAREMEIPVVWWDNNYRFSGDEWMGLFDRETLTCHNPAAVKALLDNGSY